MQSVQSLMSEMFISSSPSSPPSQPIKVKEKGDSKSLAPSTIVTDNTRIRPRCLFGNSETALNKWSIQATTSIGLRTNQEDRCLVIPKILSNDSIVGVFDGTVGDFVSSYVQTNLLGFLQKTEEMSSILMIPKDTSKPLLTKQKRLKAMRQALKSAYISLDAAALSHCTQKSLHWTSSTGVTVWLHDDTVTVAHIGDSKACLGRFTKGAMEGRWMTRDHKPNMTSELKRIQKMGGSLVWLHGGKPYLRGGDFIARQRAGQHPKQLNYSRAFGGKDLKRYGLSSEPSILQYQRSESDRVLIIGSDGLWDVVHPDLACQVAVEVKMSGRSASDALVEMAIKEMPSKGVYDNVTAVCIFFGEEGSRQIAEKF